MTRTPYLTPDEMSLEQRRIYEDIRASRGTWLNGPFAPMLHQTKLAEPAHKLGEFVRYNTSLEPRLTELAILLVARRHDCEFEWLQHKRIALEKGVPPDVAEAIRLGQRPAQQPRDAELVHDFTRSLLWDNRIPDAVYDAARDEFGVAGVVELTGLIGYYTLIALTLNAHEVPLPQGARAELPPLKVDQ